MPDGWEEASLQVVGGILGGRRPRPQCTVALQVTARTLDDCVSKAESRADDQLPAATSDAV